MSSLAEVTVSADVEAELIRLRNERVMENQGLVNQVAWGFRSRGIPLEELCQFGNLGLIRAAEKFDPDRGLQFSTYAVYWIRQSIFRGIATDARTIRLPAMASREVAEVLRRGAEMRAGGPRVGLREVIATMNLKLPKAERVLQAVVAALPPNYEFDEKLDVLDRSASASPESRAIDAEHRVQLSRASALLTDTQRLVLSRRYGSPPMNVAEVARMLGVCRKTAEKIELDAIATLRKHLNR